MAIFTQIIAIDVIAIFTCGASAIMARATIAGNATMIKIDIAPTCRYMTIIAGITTSDVITGFTQSDYIVMA
tara:strand:- start:1090 stop:1305 length:216 start_codon:yes stop_codon:yes gene_type:complete